MRFGIKESSGTEQSVNTTSLPSGQWAHVAVTLNGNNAALYVNGVAKATGSTITASPSNINLLRNYLGRSQFNDPLFNGKIVDFRLYNYALSAAEVAGLSISPPFVAYKFDETSGTVAANDGSASFNATLVNTPTWSIGLFGNAVTFPNTASQYVTMPAGILSGVTDCTVSTWVKVGALAMWSRIFDFGTNTSNYMFLTTTNGTKVRFAIRTPSVSEQIIDGTGPLSTGTWVHVAVTLSGSVGKLYVNGTLVGTNNAMTLNPSSLGSTNLNYIGKSQFNDPYLSGSVDNFRIYNRAFSAGEVATLANLSVP